MFKSVIIFPLLLCWFSIAAIAQTPKMRRVCRDATTTDNILFFYPVEDTCSLFKQYYVWARNGPSGSFSILDSIQNKSADNYRHINANPGIPTLWYYFIQSIDSCGPTYSVYSDTLLVDIIPPDTVFIDSVSIDILNNQVQVGWKYNNSPDFLNFVLYRVGNGGIYTSLTPGGTRDTFAIDFGTNPQVVAYDYDLLSRDSCTNPQVFAINPHRPVLLNRSIDTCLKTVQLNWSGYKGWPTKITYIYENTDGGGFNLIDSIPPSIYSYQKPIELGRSYIYYLRVFADTGFVISSSSNAVSFTTRLRIDPDTLWLKAVSYKDNGQNPIEVSIVVPNNADVSKVDIIRRFGDNSVTNTGFTGNTDAFIWSDISAENLYYTYQARAFDLCNNAAGYSNFGNNILVTTTITGNDVVIHWNKYLGWYNGVENYKVYKAVIDNLDIINFEEIGEVGGSDSSFVDKNGMISIGKMGLYFLIKAKQLGASPWSESVTVNSNYVRVLGETTIYIPNAFVPSGVNTHFTFKGSFLDYKKSSLVVYDRWGGIVKNIQDMTTGWDGTDNNGLACPVGVYYYQFTIFDLDGKEFKKTGLVSLLN
jgi:gliding motility-associated-like protein